jgi:tRNA-specific 2-thiouridylase
MSGGVDSSVAAHLLKEQGYRVIALFMKNWEEGEDCPAVVDYDDVVSVCEKLSIPHYSVNFAKEYKEQVFSYFLEELKAGLTPNPDILCNREIKFKVLLEKALELGADYLATGHYCRVGEDFSLLRGLDANKDQSYFLHAIGKDVLDKVLFPIGDMEKPKVRALAEELDLVTSKKKDSTGICFIGKRNFKDFVSQFITQKKGPFQTLEGKTLGEHDGAPFYTIGQRKGLGIGGEGAAWFVVKKDLEKNIVYLAQGQDHKELYTSELFAKDLTFIQESPKGSFSCTAKVRYRQEDQGCHVTLTKEGAHVVFDEPQRAVTLGQSVVFYEKERCLGGGVICR